MSSYMSPRSLPNPVKYLSEMKVVANIIGLKDLSHLQDWRREKKKIKKILNSVPAVPCSIPVLFLQPLLPVLPFTSPTLIIILVPS